MQRLKTFISGLFIVVLISGCHIAEPEHSDGSIRIHLVRKHPDSALQKQTDQLSDVECTIWRDLKIIYVFDLEKRENTFIGEIRGLIPDTNYAILLLGRSGSHGIVARGYTSEITVEIGAVTDVEIEWISFKPNLLNPYNEMTIETQTPDLEWYPVQDAVNYQLKVDPSNSFTSPIIWENNINQTYYTPMDTLPLGSYYWKVACQDSFGNWGKWSDVWRFFIE
jgi:hypothetical protein